MSQPSPQSFYTERIPTQFNRALDEQAEAGEDGARLLASMQAVNATLCIVARGEGGGTFYLNVAEGRMTPGESAANPPFLTLVHDEKAFQVLEREAGDSALGFLGGLAGMAGEIRLTQQRLDNLQGLAGSLQFEVTGNDGFSLWTHFGSDPLPEEPHCRIQVTDDAYRELRGGNVNPQDAFMSGKIQVEGDMQMAMQLALAVLSPDV
ncbi:MAG: SCP2 sterol-binding domain-containing protein [Proteobacteria bacterium]|nr:SCP2 sterol-binding domain-containing protein [Pseudomonadota bacterium]